ncbi:MAG: hypothetical protein ACOC9Z_00150 [Chloroflexota bacterium]
MSSSASSLPLDDNAEDTGGGTQEVRWIVVAEATGLLPAHIIADRLQAEGIPAHAWQESVGQAYGMVYGPLGTGFVSVPEEYVEAAQEILAQSAETDLDSDGEEE